MKRKYLLMLGILLMLVLTISCTLSGIRQQASDVEQTAQALRTDVSGIVSMGSSLINTARALETQHPGILETVKALGTKGAPAISTMKAVSTNNPGLVQTAQAMFENEIPTGEPPSDIPVFARHEAENYFASSQYIFYTTPNEYTHVLAFYKIEMLAAGWQYQDGESHEYANAALLKYDKDTRTARINMSHNPLNKTTVVVIDIDNP